MSIKINEDSAFVAKMRRALEDNDGYCPCALVRNNDTKCMCRAFREARSGVCHCGLYTKTAEPSPAGQFDHA